jgi:hypothetical protein
MSIRSSGEDKICDQKIVTAQGRSIDGLQEGHKDLCRKGGKEIGQVTCFPKLLEADRIRFSWPSAIF